MRNKVGLKLLSVANSTFDENFDISLEVPAKLTESSSNIMRLVNKKLEADFCRTNKCNTKSYLTVQDNTEEKATLLKALKTAIQEWILS